ncbi:ABC transporter ATP-binding protein/permease [Gammaproteobacteria bacterium]|nr:ABC transporter ATP-binding protein/permease [Gammaproteobacteria bacterium]
MSQSLFQLFHFLTAAQKKKFFLLQLLIIFMSITEVISLMLIGGFLSIISDFEQIYNNSIAFYFFNYLDQDTPEQFIAVIGFGVLFFLIFSALLSVFTVWRLSIFSAQIGAHLSSQLFAYYMLQPWLFHAAGNSSELINKIAAETERVNSGIISPLLQLNAKIILAFLICISLFIYDPIVASLIAFVFSSSYFVLFFTVRRSLTINGERISRFQALRYKLMGEGFGGIKELLLSGRQNYFIDQFEEASINFSYAKARNLIFGQIPRYLIEMVAFSMVIIFVLYLVLTSTASLASIFPVISLYALAALKLLPALQQIYYSLSMIRGHLPGLHNMEEDLKRSAEASNQKSLFDLTTNECNFSKNVRLENISFSYEGTSQKTLQNINLNIGCNQTIGIVGSSGSGKSTIIDILLGLIQPDSGAIFLDDVKLDSTNLRLWQQSIGFVSQNIFLADETIEKNITFGISNEQVDKEKLSTAIALAQLKDFIVSLPKKEKTIVGERGVQLSGGQRQRIGIARALYNNSKILILDEATSSLDGITEKLIMESINSFMGKKTLIIIAHRLSTVKKCDQIYLLEKGKILEEGNFEVLSKKSTIFQHMIDNA